MSDSQEIQFAPEADETYNEEPTSTSFDEDTDDADVIALDDDVRRSVFGLGINSYNRMDSVLSLFRLHKHRRIDCFKALGMAWAECDNIATHKDDLRAILEDALQEELDAMMSKREREVLASLPRKITIYRGCYMDAQDGLSWTLNKQVAQKHPFLNRYDRPDSVALCLKARVTKSRCVLKLGRDEEEIICYMEPTPLGFELLSRHAKTRPGPSGSNCVLSISRRKKVHDLKS